MKFNVLPVLAVLIFSCSKNSDPVSPDKNNSFFGIYFLKDTTLTERDIEHVEIKDLVLNDDAWLTEEDIGFYDFSTHCIYLKRDKSCFFYNYVGNFFVFSPSFVSKTFVIVAGTERCYV